MSADTIPDEMRVSLASVYVRQNFETGEPWSMTIARAIMEERERCLQICEAEYERRFNSDYPAARRHDFIVVARAIQKSIKLGTEGVE